MSHNCTNCTRHCNPATDCDTCPACRLLLDTARQANRRANRMQIYTTCCAAVAVLAVVVAALVNL